VRAYRVDDNACGILWPDRRSEGGIGAEACRPSRPRSLELFTTKTPPAASPGVFRFGMDRIWQWVWDRYGARYSWACWVVTFPVALPIYLGWSLAIVSFEGSDHYVEATALTVVAVLPYLYVLILPGTSGVRLVERWAAGEDVDRATALQATYRYGRTVMARSVVLTAVMGAIAATAGQLVTVHSYTEGALRPARSALTSGAGIGDSLPRSRPTFATWTFAAMVALGFAFTVLGALLGDVFDVARHGPALAVVLGGALVVVVVPSLWAAYLPLLQPIRDLAEGTERVAAGDYSQRLPVVQDDDLGALAASFNRMQAGLAERQRLQAAFGTYVDPVLAARLIEQGDDVFTGERREVTVMFVDIRDFTPFAEANSAEDTVARLNALFEIVVPAVVGAGGHVNKFLGDGALAVFGAPNDLVGHADAAVSAAALIHRLLRIGIGINTGKVIEGTIGAGGKLEFTLIGDTVNVAARVEQLTKTTGDAILLTQQTVEALASKLRGLTERGAHVLKGKSAAVQVYGVYSAMAR